MSQYMKNWDHIKKYLPYFLRSLDVRVVELPPNVALAIVRALGGRLLCNQLNKSKETPAVAVKALRESMLGELILAEGPRERRQLKKTAADTRDEFVRIQSTAKTDDKPLNVALGIAIERLLAEHGRGTITVGKKQSMYGSLKPDVHIKLQPSAPLCIEVTWRATGHQVEGVQCGKQNTLTPGHIRPYTLAKAYEYVKALGLDAIGSESV